MCWMSLYVRFYRNTCIHFIQSYASSAENSHFLWLTWSCLTVSPWIFFQCRNMFLLEMCECAWIVLVWMCSWNRQTQRTVRGKGKTSLRMSAICEFRYLIDPSGPWSPFSISIYHHFSSQDHINVSPSCLTHFPLFLSSQVSTSSVDQATHLRISWFRMSAPHPNKKSKPVASQSVYWKLLDNNSQVFSVKFRYDR